MAKIRLKEVCKKKGLSEYAFAKLVGTSQANVAPYFKGEGDPKLSTLAKWAKVLNIGVRELIED